MFIEERHDYIVNKIKRNRKVSVNELTEELNVSAVTIRKDLEELENRGYLQRTHGGAILADNLVNEMSYQEKEVLNINKKKIIAQRAIEFIEDGMYVFLDAGTTVFLIAQKLERYTNLTIVTYDFKIASYLLQNTNFNITFLGGNIDRKLFVANSVETLRALERFNFDLAFIASDAFNEAFVQSSSSLRRELKSTAIGHAMKSILVVDSTKYGRYAKYNIDRVQNFEIVITDDSDYILNGWLRKN